MKLCAALATAALLCSGALAQAQPQDAWPADCKLEPVAQLPMTLHAGHVVIPATADGKELMLGIDTGGFGSSLTETGADRLGVAAPNRSRLGAVVPGIGGLWASGGSVHLDELRIGDLELNRIFLPVMMAFPDADGLIGPDILAKYDAEFDFGGKTFRLLRHHPCANRAVTWTGSYVVIPFTLTRDGHLRVPVTLDGRNAQAILDTGAGISVMSMEDADGMFGLGPNSANVKAANPVSGFSWRNPVHAYSTVFKTLTIGGVTIPDPRMELVEGRNFLGHDFATLVLGNDVLSRFHLYVAYQEQKLYLSDAHAD